MSKRININDLLVSETMVPRSVSSRKGENGILLVIGASDIYHGAPLLSSMAGLDQGSILFILVYHSETS